AAYQNVVPDVAPAAAVEVEVLDRLDRLRAGPVRVMDVELGPVRPGDRVAARRAGRPGAPLGAGHDLRHAASLSALRQARQRRFPPSMRVFSGVNSWPRLQCVWRAWSAAGDRPRRTFSRCVTGSRWAGFTHSVFEQRWSTS